MRGSRNAVGWRSLAIVLPVWALIAPGVCAAFCDFSHCGEPSDRVESHARHGSSHHDQAEPCASGEGLHRGATSADSPYESGICRCEEVASAPPKAVDTGSAVSANLVVVPLQAPAAPVVHLQREVSDLPVHPFPAINPPLLI